MRVLIDTFNSANSEGVGIATYTRALTRAVHAERHTVTLLAAAKRRQASRSSNGSAAAPDAVLVFDTFSDDAAPQQGDNGEHSSLLVRNKLYSARKLAAVWSSLLGFRRKDEPIDAGDLSAVQLGTLRERIGYFDEILTMEDVFHRSLELFRRRGRFLSIDPPRPVEIAHLTWALPIHVRGARTIWTIHDLIPLRLPFATTDDQDFFFRLAKRCADTADVVATVSETSRRDIVNLLGVPEHKVINTAEASDIPDEVQRRTPEAVAAKLRSTFGLKYREFFLLAGSIEPRKNVARAIEAHIGSRSEFPLVLCGPTPQAFASTAIPEALKPSIQRGLTPRASDGMRRVIVSEYLPKDMLHTLMLGARAVIMPSLYEGFGLPLLEAMVLGTPVIASKIGALQELCGPAAVYIDPYDVRSLRDAIETVSAWNESQHRAASAAARRQAQLFSPAKFQGRIASIYRDLAKRV